MNWICCDGDWINLDFLTQISVYEILDIKQFNIRAWNDKDEKFDLFDKCFKTRKEAQEYLNKHMKGKSVTSKMKN